MISKKDVCEKKFNVVKKGYDIAQVDALLDEIAAALEEYEKTAGELETFRGIEKQLSSALIAAQNTATDIVSKAQAQANETISASEEQAARILEEAKNQREQQLGTLETEKDEIIDKIKKLKDFTETYKQCILMDMDNHKEAFLQGFLSEAKFDDVADEIPEDEPEEEVAAEPEVDKVAPDQQLDTGEMESIDLAEIVNNLPNADDELKALIEDIL